MPMWRSFGYCDCLCDSQVWKWSRTLASIPASQSTVAAAAAASPLTRVCLSRVTRGTRWVTRSQLFVRKIISGVTPCRAAMVRTEKCCKNIVYLPLFFLVPFCCCWINKCNQIMSSRNPEKCISYHTKFFRWLLYLQFKTAGKAVKPL